jgi:hypothetical protein
MVCRQAEVLRHSDPDQSLPHDLLRGADRSACETG